MDHENTLIAWVQASDWLMAALADVQTLRLQSWAIGAGAVRDVVWNRLHGLPDAPPASDVDVVHFDPCRDDDDTLQAQLVALSPLRWEVVNQAGVHRWRPGRAPYASLIDGIGSWPEVVTCVAVTLDDDGRVGVIAPYGLDDLFAMVARPNPHCPTSGAFTERMAKKRWGERWPRVRIVD